MRSMQKIIISKTGYFTISADCLLELIKMKFPYIEENEGNDDEFNDFEEFKEGFKKEKFFEDRLEKNGIIYSLLDHDDLRTNETFITMIEQFGEKANTSHSKLKIIEIPNDVKWCIKLCDQGGERIEEIHRVWF
jgi:hypothetical protein